MTPNGKKWECTLLCEYTEGGVGEKGRVGNGIDECSDGKLTNIGIGCEQRERQRERERRRRHNKVKTD